MNKCKICGKEFKSANSLGSHLGWHSNPNPRSLGWKDKPIRMFGNDNPTKRPEVKIKIKQTIEKKYKNGVKMGFSKTFKYKQEVKDCTIPIELDRCDECGETEGKIILHHVDGNRNNNLWTNQQPLCGSCHVWKQYQPYMTLEVKTSFDSAHKLENYEGKCHELHGHTYYLSATVGGKLNKQYMVQDFIKIKKELKSLTELVDHTFLNKALEFDMPTCEWLLFKFFSILSKKIKGLKGIKLSESNNTSAFITDEYFLEMIGHKELWSGDHNV